MKASILDLRYRMKDVLKALKRNEKVEILYHGKTKGVIMPKRKAKTKHRVTEHPFFGMNKVPTQSVQQQMNKLLLLQRL